LKEDTFINLIKNALPASNFYIGDDTAYIAHRDLVLTVDTLIEDVHFRRATISPFDLGIKSVAVNLSDIAAAGAIPEFILISLSLPPDIDETFIKEFYGGVNTICTKYGVLVVGGDITGASKISISITVIGKSGNIPPAGRGNAKHGDIVFVTGEFGSSRAGLWILEEALKNSEKYDSGIDDTLKEKFIKAHINPVPQLEIGRETVKTASELSQSPPAMMDSSDGLADALYKICKMSNVSMDIELENIPSDIGLKDVANLAKIDPLKWIFFGGEDYQLVVTVPEEVYQQLKAKGLNIYSIGKVTPSQGNPAVSVKHCGNTIFEITQQSLDNNGFDHFKN